MNHPAAALPTPPAPPVPRRRALGLLAGAPLAMAVGATRLEAGCGRILVPEPTGATQDPIPVWYCRPASWQPGDRVVVVVHGMERNAEAHRDAWRQLSEAGRFLLLVPELAEAKFPGTFGFNFGNVIDAAHKPQPRTDWSFTAFDRAVQHAMRLAGATRPSFSIYAHSSGAQFLHRYLLLTGAPLAETLVLANASVYTLPRTDRLFPEGLGGITPAPDALMAAFRCHVVLLLGEGDTDPNSPKISRQPFAASQGSHRFARGWFFFDTMRLAAEARGAMFTWQVKTVPGVGHSGSAMAEYAARALFAPGP